MKIHEKAFARPTVFFLEKTKIAMQRPGPQFIPRGVFRHPSVIYGLKSPLLEPGQVDFLPISHCRIDKTKIYIQIILPLGEIQSKPG